MQKEEFNIPKDKNKAEKRINKLRDEIRYHNKKYYIEDNPVISDYEYDQLFEELKALEKKFPDLVTEDSPTQRIGSEEIDEFETVEHKVEMLSLDKTFDSNGLYDFDRKVREKLKKQEVVYVVEPKIDGLGIALLYENKRLKRGATRGDGARGEDVTPNVKTIKSIPLKLSDKSDLKNIEVRGEIYIPKDAFKEMNQNRIDNSKEQFANPRNAASGTIRNKDPKRVAKRPLDAFLYSLSYYEESEFQTHWKTLKELKKAGLRINDNLKKFKGIEKVVEHVNKWEEEKDELNYEVDGIVIKVNDLEAQKKLGSTTHHPRWAIAYKYPPMRKTTKVKDIEVMVGRTGKLTPVAILDPIHLSGTEVSRASLHNEDELQRKDIRIGDTVLVEKAGEIIPQVIKSIKEKRDGSEKKFEFPHTCPVCGSVAKRFGDEVARRCVNAQCPAQVKQRIEHWGSREAMEIDGLGPKLLDKLVDQGLAENIADIYELKKSDLTSIERMGKKSSENLLKSIENSKNRDLSKVLFGLGITYIGEHIARVLTENYHSIDDLIDASEQELENIDEIGPKIAQSIVAFFNEEKNLDLIKRLKKHGINMEKEMESRANFLDGKKFVFTGALEKYTRAEASEQVRKYGGRITSSVSGETDYLVVGKNPGSKLEEAKNQDVKIIDEERFLSLLKNQ
ncbi:MAG: NAD-dependent DNA ligase LigA [Candidatus Lokiarchaeota archaeon]|nr:NAD-dependent DNA ligase LigA [Candidatus Lokiarchaeota archaeon]MBD3339706.1 NAD-dependent DNA ligase LigA [Candidatus Lokiarchaeota archaeon]